MTMLKELTCHEFNEAEDYDSHLKIHERERGNLRTFNVISRKPHEPSESAQG